MKSVKVRVPASTSNLGSGFDTLGLAVNLSNTFTLTRGASGVLTVHDDKTLEIVEAASALFFETARAKRFTFSVEIHGNIPVARGLGASGALRAGIVAGLNELTGEPLDQQQLLELLTTLEGHPDNASPALLGGCTVSGRVGNEVRCLRFRVRPKLRIVALIPRFRVSTEEARRLMPQSFSKADAAHALNRSALIAAAFASQDYESLRGLFDDRFHQPYREKLIPQLHEVIRAGERAGAIGGFLSGSGSAIICLTLQKPDEVSRALQSKLPDSEVLNLRADNRGLAIL